VDGHFVVLTYWVLVIVLAAAYLAGSQYLWRVGPPHARDQQPVRSTASNDSEDEATTGCDGSFVTGVLVLFLIFTAVLQWIVPAVLAACRRDASRIAEGEWWRIGTALLFQDGGITGTIFNVVTLLLVGQVAERIWGGRRWLVIFFAGGVLTEIVALAWHAVGAGNSVANFSLAGSVSLLCLVLRPTFTIVVAAAVALAGGVALLLLHDIHGAATIFGATMGLALISLDRSRQQRVDS
jgi:rhomboid protease GluP